MPANKPRLFRVDLARDNCFYFISRSGRDPTRQEILDLAAQHLHSCFLKPVDMTGTEWSFNDYEWCSDEPIPDIDGGETMGLADAANLCAGGKS